MDDERLDLARVGEAHAWRESDGEAAFRVTWAAELRTATHLKSIVQFRTSMDEAKRDAEILLRAGPPLRPKRSVRSEWRETPRGWFLRDEGLRATARVFPVGFRFAFIARAAGQTLRCKRSLPTPEWAKAEAVRAIRRATKKRAIENWQVAVVPPASTAGPSWR